MPMFTNVFQIYAMCNLHDVSWGNRPTSTGTEAFTANKSTQADLEGDYKVFRTNFVLFWLIANIGYYIMILQFINGETQDGTIGYLEVFSLMLAAMVVFRVTFAAIYILGWKCRYCCVKRYVVQQ